MTKADKGTYSGDVWRRREGRSFLPLFRRLGFGGDVEKRPGAGRAVGINGRIATGGGFRGERVHGFGRAGHAGAVAAGKCKQYHAREKRL